MILELQFCSLLFFIFLLIIFCFWEGSLQPFNTICHHLQDFTLEQISFLQEIFEKNISYTEHKKFKDHQRNQFKQQKLALQEGECLIVMDFKENLQLGGSAREIGQIFYSKTQISLLGSVIYFIDQGTLKKKHVNFLSKLLSHDGVFVKDCLRTLLSRYCSNLHSFKFWFDCGPHFRSKEVLHYLLVDYPNISFSSTSSQKSLQVNYFAPSHGKSVCDSHFSTLSHWFRSYENSFPLTNFEQLIPLWLEANEVSNQQKRNHKPLLDLNFEIYERTQRPFHVFKLKISGVKQYFSWERSGNFLFRKMKTGVGHWDKVKVLSERIVEHRKDKFAPTFSN